MVGAGFYCLFNKFCSGRPYMSNGEIMSIVNVCVFIRQVQNELL